LSLTDEQLDVLLDREFIFRDRPQPAPSDLRPVWRLPIVLLLVDSCRQRRATHEQLHVLNWAVRSTTSAEALARFLAGELAPGEAVVRFEPALDRAATLARGFGLITWKGRFWELTAKGRELLEDIRADDALLAREKELLTALPKPLTQTAVEALLKRTTP
jgi:hypothetical protein